MKEKLQKITDYLDLIEYAEKKILNIHNSKYYVVFGNKTEQEKRLNELRAVIDRIKKRHRTLINELIETEI